MYSRLAEWLLLERPLVIFDLETTGLAVGEDRMIEIAYRKIDPSGAVTAVEWRVNPGRPISADATAVHGIRDENVASAPSFGQVCYSLWSVFDGVDVGGFNVIGYDLPFLKAEFALMGKNFDYSRHRILDAKTLYHSIASRDWVGARNLASAYRIYCGKEHTEAHTAAGDVAATLEVLEALLEKYPVFRNWDYLSELHGRKKDAAPATPAAAVDVPPPASTLF